MRKRRLSVPGVVAITLVAGTTLLLGSFATGTYIREKDREYERLRDQAKQMAERGAVALALPVWNIDREQIDHVVESACNAADMELITVDAAARTHAVMRGSDGRCVRTSHPVPPPGLIGETHAIDFRGERIGTISVYLSPKLIDQELRETLLRTILTILILDALIIFFVYLVLWVAVLQPLSRIERYAVAVTAGEENPELELSPALTSDLENLRRSIERMVQLQESLRRTETLSKMGALVGGVAHEIRNPLFGISALLDAYASDLNAPELREFGDGVREEVARLSSLTRELLDYGRPTRAALDAGAIEPVIENAVRSRATLAIDCGVTVTVSTSGKLPQVPMDRDRLCQAFGNLIDNAIRHSPRGGVVAISAAVSDGHVECRIEDQGSGFAPGDIEHAFEPFFSRRADGIGLGLSIVERVVREHCGSVELTNVGNAGARVYVRLPAQV